MPPFIRHEDNRPEKDRREDTMNNTQEQTNTIELLRLKAGLASFDA